MLLLACTINAAFHPMHMEASHVTTDEFRSSHVQEQGKTHLRDVFEGPGGHYTRYQYLQLFLHIVKAARRVRRDCRQRCHRRGMIDESQLAKQVHQLPCSLSSSSTRYKIYSKHSPCPPTSTTRKPSCAPSPKTLCELPRMQSPRAHGCIPSRESSTLYPTARAGVRSSRLCLRCVMGPDASCAGLCLTLALVHQALLLSAGVLAFMFGFTYLPQAAFLR